MAKTTNAAKSNATPTGPQLPPRLTQGQLRKMCLLFLSMIVWPDSTDSEGPLLNWSAMIRPHMEDLPGAKVALTTIYETMSPQLGYAQSAMQKLLNQMTTTPWDESGNCPMTLSDITDLFAVVAPDPASGGAAKTGGVTVHISRS